MADKYREFLAARVLTDDKPVTYRVLSRELKINVHVAKQMLYEFHANQNAKKPNSIHATYLLSGRKRISEHTNGTSGRDGEDSFMHSSPYMSSMPESQEQSQEASSAITSIVLVREEELEATKAEFEEISSMHVYSLEPSPLENLNLLSVCTNEVATMQTNDDPLERWSFYGSINNPYIKRRTAKFAPKPAPAAAVKPAAKPAAVTTSKPNPGAATKEKSKDTAASTRRGSTSEATSGRSTPQPAPAANNLKKTESKSNLKREKSDLFKSFAKAKPKAKAADKSKESTPVAPEDETMQGMSEDEGDNDDQPEVEFDEQKAAEARQARAEREEKLRKMMEDDDDEDMPDAPVEEKGSQDSVPAKVDAEPAGAETTVTVQGGRRRGRRKVMKKKKVKDEDGYLVTKEEAVWESFSEDEPEPKKLKPAPKPAASTNKGKKPGKPGQGSIASFFKKA